MRDQTRGPGARTIALTAVAMAAFAANSLLCRFALADGSINPGSFTAVRILSGVAMLWGILRLSRTSRKIEGSWAGAAALFIYAAAFSYAYITLSAGTGALLLFGAVQITMVAIGLARGDRLRAPQWGGLIVALTGLCVLLAPGASAPPVAGAVLMLTSGVAWGVYSLLGRGAVDPFATTYGNFVRAAPAALLLLALATIGQGATRPIGILSAILSGTLASGVGYTIWYAALPRLSPVQGASVQLSVPVLAATAGAMMLGEHLSMRLLLTSCAILGGVAVVIASRPRERGR